MVYFTIYIYLLSRPLTSLFAHFFRVDEPILILQRVECQISVETDRVVVFTLVRVAAQLVGFLYVGRTVGGYDEFRGGLENRFERSVRVVTGSPTVFAEKQRAALVFLVPIF
jgi:hypothetical protein